MMSHKQNNFHSAFRQAGVTLMELIASLAVMAVVVSGAISLYNGASSSERATAMTRDVMAIQTAVKALYSGQGTYGAPGTNLNGVLVNSKKLPTTIAVTPGNPPILTHQNRGTINVLSTGAGFAVTLTEISQDICISLMTQSSGWTSVKVGNGASRSLPVPINIANTDCGTGTTLTFTY